MSILKKLRKRRNEARAEIKAAKERVRREVKAANKAQERQQKLLAKQEKQLLKDEKKNLKAKRKHELKMAKAELDRIKTGKLNKANVQRYAGAARAAAPLLLPLAYRAITAGREALEQRRAQRAGISADQMAEFSGHGAPLRAKTQGIRNSLKESSLPLGYQRDVRDQLDEIDAAIDNAEFMTPQQRRRAHHSIQRDIDSVTQDIQNRINRL